MKKTSKKVGLMPSWLFWNFAWILGIAGQLCWNMENQWFNTFVYSKISGDVNIVTAMVIVSALVTTISTFIFGTLSDRIGKRRKFVSIGYIIWGITTILFGLTEFFRKSEVGSIVFVSAFLVVLTDAIMSFFGSMGNDSGYSTWLNDHTDDSNKGKIGALLAALPVFGTVVGTVLGGILVNVGNETVGTETYNPALDNYQLLFGIMGGFVIIVGIISLLFLKDAPNIEPNKDGTFIHQFSQAFNVKKLKGGKNNKEMFLACLVACFFFIPFNFYFIHMGNWMIYDIKFTAGDMGLIEGISLLLAVILTLPFSKMIDKNKIPQLCFFAVIVNAIGLLVTFLTIKSPSDVDTTNLFSLKNIPIFICVFLIGLGYVLIMQACMVWTRSLFPKECRGQFEGIRVSFFTLIPMLIGTLIGNLIIKLTNNGTNTGTDDFGHIIDVPQENLFFYAFILVLLTFIPLFFASRLYFKRIKKEKEELICINQKLNSNENLLTKNKKLNIHGYSFRYDVNYNKEVLSKHTLKLKEWNFYQFIFDDYSLQITTGHLSYIGNISCNLINLKTGERVESSLILPLHKFNLDLNPEKESEIHLDEKGVKVDIIVTNEFRNISYKSKEIEVDLKINNDPNNEKMVIATGFDNPKMFYLNYKENYYYASGKIKTTSKEFEIDNVKGLIDWGRGIWPYKHTWVWGNLTSEINGIPFGLNIGYGFGNLYYATENAFFYNHKGYKLGKVNVKRNPKNYMEEWEIESDDKLLKVKFVPIFDNFTSNKFVVVNTSCHQVYGYFSGEIVVDGEIIPFKNLLGFIEEAKNRW